MSTNLKMQLDAAQRGLVMALSRHDHAETVKQKRRIARLLRQLRKAKEQSS
jgi:hypothetical protein